MGPVVWGGFLPPIPPGHPPTGSLEAVPKQKEIDVDTLRKWTVSLPECVFLFGADLKHVDPALLEADRARRIGLGSALALTPPHWVHLEAFSFGRHMVSNGEYLRFLKHVLDGPDSGGERLYDHSDIWDEVWTGQNFRIDRVMTSSRKPGGPVEEVEEFYGDAANFVEAYVASIQNESIRLLESDKPLAPDTPAREKETRIFLAKKGKAGMERVELKRGGLIHRLFAFIKLRLKDSILPPDGDERSLLTEKERGAIEGYSDPKKVTEDIQSLITRLRQKYSESIDRRFRQRFASGRHQVETILFLERFRKEFEKEPESSTIPLRRVLYPRGWPGPDGKRRGALVGGGVRHVPWADLPVVGISLYEALAYTVWLSTLTGSLVTLPNEAEYERASSWPVTAGLLDGRKVLLDPREKDLFPWQKEDPGDFHSYFGRVGEDLQNYYVADRTAYEQLVKDTSRKIARRDRLYQLEGFGWQWTVDRLNEDEIRYSRFKDPGYRRYRGKPCKIVDDPKGEVEVFDYRPNPKVDSPYFVLKGSPDVLGGAGITPRRYGAFPLRGYPNVGLRLVVKDREGG